LTIAASTTATTCTYTNSRIAQQLNLAKAWTNGRTNDRVTVTTSGGTANPSLDSTAPGTGLIGTAVTVYAGDVVMLPAETFATGSQANYTTTLACSGGSPLASGATGRTVTIAANTTATTCTYTNARKAVTFRLAKAWGANSISGNVASIGATTGMTANTALFTSTASTAANSNTVTAYAGETTTLPAETFSTGSATNYTTVLACDNSVTPSGSNGQASNTVTMPNTLAANTLITCTYTNSRIAQQLNLAKAWTNGLANDRVTVTTSGGTANASLDSTAPGTGLTGTAETVYAGDVVTLPAETFATGSQANYTTTLACSGGSPLASGATGRTVTIAANTTATTCTYTNTRVSQQLNLAKAWVNGGSGHTATATTTATGLSSTATFNSTAPSTGLTGSAVTVYAGDSITLPAETFGGGATAAMYTATVACSGGTTLASGAAGRSVTVGASAAATTCTYTNSRVSSQLTLAKSWVNGRLNDAVDVTVSRGGSGIDTLSAVSAGTASETDTDATPVTVYAGETLVLSESFTAPAGAGSLYTAAVACSGAGSTLAGTSLTVGTGGTAITCTYTNTRIAQQIRLSKTWQYSLSGQSISVATTGGTANPVITSAAPVAGNGSYVTVYAGDALALPVETFTGASASDYNTTVACSGGSTLAATAPPSSITISNSTTATTCAYSNVGKFVDLAITKTNTPGVNGNVDQASDTVAGGSTTTYEITVINYGPAPATGAVVRDTPVSQLTCAGAGAVTCSPAAACTGTADIASLTGGGITLGTLNAGQSVTLAFACQVD
jgi:uncharacterized protein YjlB